MDVEIEASNMSLLTPIEDMEATGESNSLGDPSLMISKIAAMCLLGVSTFVLGVLPLKLATCLQWKIQHEHHAHHAPGHHPHNHQSLVISLLLCFGGGVLLFTTMMHLQPEVMESTDRLIKLGKISPIFVDSGVNLAQLIFCSGFFLVYLIEELVHLILDRWHQHEDDEIALHRMMSVRKCESAALPCQPCQTNGMIPRITLNGNRRNGQPPNISASTQVLFREGAKPETLDPRVRMLGGPLESAETASSTSSPPPTAFGKSFRGLFTIVALSFHSVFEGLAVGLQDSQTNVFYLSAAIATHKLVIAFCVGVELVCSRTRRFLIFLYVATFAVVTPIGIGVGLGLSYGGGDSSPNLIITSVILQGMAAGTLLYVVFFEVLQKEKNKEHSGFIQFVCILAGFLVMFCLHVLLGGHSHHHGYHMGEEHDHDDHAHNTHDGHSSHSHR